MRETDHNTILIIDDDPDNVKTLKNRLDIEGYDTLTSYDGVTGWETLQQHKDRIGAILLERTIPKIDGMEFVTRLKADTSAAYIPVIMQSTYPIPLQVPEATQAGIYYYLSKPCDLDVMLSVVWAAINDYAEYSLLRSELQQHPKAPHVVNERTFEVRTLNDVRALSSTLAQYYPDSKRVILGISEMLINAVEHGNLGITYEDKTRLTKEQRWEEEVIKRAELPEYRNKKVHVHLQQSPDEMVLTITDEGKGFDWNQYMDITPERAGHSHGRGIALSNIWSFDSIEYHGNGNRVTCKVRLTP